MYSVTTNFTESCIDSLLPPAESRCITLFIVKLFVFQSASCFWIVSCVMNFRMGQTLKQHNREALKHKTSIASHVI